MDAHGLMLIRIFAISNNCQQDFIENRRLIHLLKTGMMIAVVVTPRRRRRRRRKRRRRRRRRSRLS